MGGFGRVAALLGWALFVWIDFVTNFPDNILQRVILSETKWSRSFGEGAKRADPKPTSGARKGSRMDVCYPS